MPPRLVRSAPTSTPYRLGWSNFRPSGREVRKVATELAACPIDDSDLHHGHLAGWTIAACGRGNQIFVYHLPSALSAHRGPLWPRAWRIMISFSHSHSARTAGHLGRVSRGQTLVEQIGRAGKGRDLMPGRTGCLAGRCAWPSAGHRGWRPRCCAGDRPQQHDAGAIKSKAKRQRSCDCHRMASGLPSCSAMDGCAHGTPPPASSSP